LHSESKKKKKHDHKNPDIAIVGDAFTTNTQANGGCSVLTGTLHVQKKSKAKNATEQKSSRATQDSFSLLLTPIIST
jgi:hypothetical protein